MSDSLMCEKRRNNKINRKKKPGLEDSQNFKIAVIERKETKESESDISDATLSQRPSRDTQLLLYVNRFVSRHICLLCTPTRAYSSGMAFARAGWCLSSYYKFMAVGEANADQPCVRDEEGKSIQNREETRANIERGKGKMQWRQTDYW